MNSVLYPIFQNANHFNYDVIDLILSILLILSIRIEAYHVSYIDQG